MADDFDVVKNVKAKSAIWEGFGLKKRKHDGRLEPDVAVCKKCKAQVKCAGGGTSNLYSHVKRHHPASSSSRPASASSSGTALFGPTPRPRPSDSDARSSSTAAGMLLGAFAAVYKPGSSRATIITQKIARFLIKDLRPYTLVESGEFRAMVTCLDPRYKVPSRKHFSDVIVPNIYADVKRNVVKQLRASYQV